VSSEECGAATAVCMLRGGTSELACGNWFGIFVRFNRILACVGCVCVRVRVCGVCVGCGVCMGCVVSACACSRARVGCVCVRACARAHLCIGPFRGPYGGKMARAVCRNIRT